MYFNDFIERDEDDEDSYPHFFYLYDVDTDANLNNNPDSYNDQMFDFFIESSTYINIHFLGSGNTYMFGQQWKYFSYQFYIFSYSCSKSLA